ncbi:MAG: hypothetical protein ABH827_04775 [bacterium]
METRMDFVGWLSNKLYLTAIGLYVTIGLVMVMPVFIVKFFCIELFWASFSAFFIVSFIRAAYESLVIYESRIKDLSVPKMLFLVLVNASVMSFILYKIKPMLGYFSIPVALLISQVVVGRLKGMLWPHARPGFFAELPEKLDESKLSSYIFYCFFVGITYLAYAKLGVPFYCAFSGGFFVGVIFEEIYNVIRVYGQKLDTARIMSIGAWAAFYAFFATGIVFVLMQGFGLSGQPATIASVIVVKLVQPFSARRFILGL